MCLSAQHSLHGLTEGFELLGAERARPLLAVGPSDQSEDPLHFTLAPDEARVDRVEGLPHFPVLEQLSGVYNRLPHL